MPLSMKEYMKISPESIENETIKKDGSVSDGSVFWV